MADVVYNPLLKRNIQYLGGDSGDVDAKIAALQNAINDLQSRLNDLKNTKITKVTAAAQLSDLTNGEIFEWQTTTTQQFTQGYFYQKNGNNYTRVDLQPQYNLPIAAADTLGGVKVGSGLDIDESGILSVAAGDNLKVPRCFTQAQINTLADNDIFQWQGDTTAELVKGYFYKKNYPLPPNTWYFEITDDLLVNNTTIIKKGIYQFVSGETLSLATDYLIKYHNGDQPMLYYIANPIVGVGAITRHFETDVINNVIITDISGDNITINTGIVFNGVARNYSAGTFNKFVNANGDVIFVPFYATEGQVIAGTSVVDIVVSVINNTYNVYAPYPAPITILKSGSSGFELIQVDTQPQPTNGSDMIVHFTQDTSAVRPNIQSGNNISNLFGVVSRWFSDLNKYDCVRMQFNNISLIEGIKNLINAGYPFGLCWVQSNDTTGTPANGSFVIFYFVNAVATNAINFIAKMNGDNYNIYVGSAWRNQANEPTWKVLLAQNI